MPKDLTAFTIGSRALALLSEPAEGEIRGVTSRGVYLQVRPGQVIFLTRDPVRGPYTINIPHFPGEFTALQSGGRADCLPARITLPTEGLGISLDAAASWEAAPQSGGSLPAGEQRELLIEIVRLALPRKRWAGLAGLLAELLGLDSSGPAADPLEMRPVIEDCITSLTNGDCAALEGSMLRALGRGPGLTPSGDDLCAGILLALRRGRAVLCSQADLDSLAAAVSRAAYQKTTTYSANLIEAAAAGQADERVLAACDSVQTGSPGTPAAAEAVARWGSSSGMDTLTGIALVTLASLRRNPPPKEIR